MEKIFQFNEPFDFNKIVLTQPSPLQGGSYITKIRYNGEPLYLQFPKVLNRNGLIETNKKSYIDLMIDSENNEFIEWLENLETKLQEKIYEKRDLWFDNELELEDIETAFSTCCRPYKGGKLHLVRINIPKNKSLNQHICNVYDENQNEIEIKDINENNYLITIIEFYGVRFSSKSFQIELFAKQVMSLQNKKLFNNCIIKTNNISQPQELKKEVDINSQTVISQQLTNELFDNEKQNNQENIDQDKINNTIDQDINNENLNETSILQETTSEIQNNNLEKTPDNKEENIIFSVQEGSNEDKSNFPEENTEKDLEDLEKKDDLLDITQEIQNDINNNEGITLKKQNEVYYEMYKIAKEKAKNAKKLALEAYLEAKNIKKEHMLDDIDSSDDDFSTSSYEESDEEDREAQNEVKNIIENLE